MSKDRVKLVEGPECEVCHKKNQMGYNHPHSVHRTKRMIKPNIQKVNGHLLCTRCLRTQNKLHS